MKIVFSYEQSRISHTTMWFSISHLLRRYWERKCHRKPLHYSRNNCDMPLRHGLLEQSTTFHINVGPWTTTMALRLPAGSHMGWKCDKCYLRTHGKGKTNTINLAFCCNKIDSPRECIPKVKLSFCGGKKEIHTSHIFSIKNKHNSNSFIISIFW